ncbi:hypothetical protein GTY53_12945 [Streptomyces sp. SID7805]|nr:hypothetical protein [Streptomyces sp. SID7805]
MAWLAMAFFVPLLVLVGLGISDQGVSAQAFALSFAATFCGICARASLHPRLILRADGTLENVGVVVSQTTSCAGIHKVSLQRGGVVLHMDEGEQWVWSFSPSLFGRRSGRQARSEILHWAQSREVTAHRTVVTRRSHAFYFSDILLVAFPLCFIAAALVGGI